MSHKAFGGALALTFGLTAGLAAQTGNPPQNPPQNPPAAPTAAQAANQTVTVEGCLVQEQDVPGRAPNVAEKAGVMEDYILTSAKFLKGVPHAAGATGAAGAAAEHPTGTSGMAAASKFEVRGIAETQLKSLVGQRVEIEGRINPADIGERKDEKANPSGEKAGDLPELHGTVIRKATSTEPCPAK